jgi:hypothetical protein
MIPTTLTQQMGTQPVAAHRGGAVLVCASWRRHHAASLAAHAAPAYVAARPNPVNRLDGMVSGFWGTSVDITTIKRPARHLGPSTT